MEKQRLDKIIGASTPYSRKEIKSLVKSGRVTVDGRIAAAPDDKANPEKSVISVDGVRIGYRKNRYFMMNKPAGYLSATEDKNSPTVTDLLREEDRAFELFPAGRLDKDSEGLLILTDDGVFCHDVISPKKHVYKTYYVETAEALCGSDCEEFRRGIVLGDGTQCLPGELEITGRNCGKVKIREGKFHQVKRMLGSLGKPVTCLKRVAIGGLLLDENLEKGGYRELTEGEISKIFE